MTGSPSPTYTNQNLIDFDAQDNYTVEWAPYDTFTYHYGQWTELGGVGENLSGLANGTYYSPSAASYDPALHGVVAFDGFDPNGNTWLFQTGNWHRLDPKNGSEFAYNGSNPGHNLADDSSLMAYDAADGYLLMSNADVETDFSEGTSDVWALGGENLTWFQVAGLPQSPDAYLKSSQDGFYNEPEMVYDSADGSILAINDGGWVYSYAHGVWTNLTEQIGATIGDSSLEGLGYETLAYDPQLSGVLLFGGMCSPPHGECLDGNATWLYHAGIWINISNPSDPPDRYDLAMTFDTADGYMIAEGGSGFAPDQGPVGETWAYSTEPVLLSSVSHVTIATVSNPTDVGVPVNLSVHFSRGVGPFSYAWSFGATSNETSQTYGVPGTFTISVNVTDYDGTSGRAWLNITVNPRPTIPGSSLGFFNQETVGVLYPFIGYVAGGTGNFSFAWSFGDGTKATTLGGTHRYSAPGSYNVSFSATDSVGATVTSNETVTVAPAIAVSLSVTNTTPSILQSVLFSASVTGGAGVLTYIWSGLPAGCASTDSSGIGCVPTQAGSYAITVNVTDDYRGYGIGAINITVAFAFTVTATATTISVGQSVTLRVVSGTPSSDLMYSYTGLPPGCLSQNLEELVCTPTASGEFKVLVKVTNPSADVSATKSLLLVVTSAQPSLTFAGIASEAIPYLVGAFVALVCVSGYLWYRRRSRRPPDEEGRGPEQGVEPRH